MSSSRIILDALRQLVRVIRLNSHSVEKNRGLTGAQFFVLQKISEGGKLSINDIAKLTQTDQSSVSVVAAKLEAKRLIRKEPSPQDQRKSIVSLTRAGEKVLGHPVELVQNRLFQAIAEFSPEDRKKLAELLSKLVGRVVPQDDNSAPPPLFLEEPESP